MSLGSAPDSSASASSAPRSSSPLSFGGGGTTCQVLPRPAPLRRRHAFLASLSVTVSTGRLNNAPQASYSHSGSSRVYRWRLQRSARKAMRWTSRIPVHGTYTPINLCALTTTPSPSCAPTLVLHSASTKAIRQVLRECGDVEVVVVIYRYTVVRCVQGRLIAVASPCAQALRPKVATQALNMPDTVPNSLSRSSNVVCDADRPRRAVTSSGSYEGMLTGHLDRSGRSFSAHQNLL